MKIAARLSGRKRGEGLEEVSPGVQAANLTTLFAACAEAPYVAACLWLELRDNPFAKLYFGVANPQGRASPPSPPSNEPPRRSCSGPADLVLPQTGRFAGAILYFANAHSLLADVAAFVGDRRPLAWFCLDCAAISDVDYSAAQALRRAHQELQGRGARLVLAEVSPYVRAELDRYGLTALVGPGALFDSLGGVLDAYRARADGAETTGAGGGTLSVSPTPGAATAGDSRAGAGSRRPRQRGQRGQ